MDWLHFLLIGIIVYMFIGLLLLPFLDDFDEGRGLAAAIIGVPTFIIGIIVYFWTKAKNNDRNRKKNKK